MAMEASTVVIKVKHGDFLRRFNAIVMDNKLDLSMDQLVEKINFLFNFAPDTELTLTYIDEDGDTVTLVDDDDLCDVVKQALNPLRISVHLNAEKNSSPFVHSTGSSTPLRSPQVQQPLQNSNPVVSEIFKFIPDSLSETFAKLSTELVSKVSSSAPGITPGVGELVEYFSNMGLSYLDQISESQSRVQPSAQNDVPESRITVAETIDSSLSEADPTTLKVPSKGGSEKQLSKNNEMMKVETANGGSMDVPSSKAPVAPKARDNVSTEKEVNDTSGPHVGPNPAFVGTHDRMTGDSFDGTMRYNFPPNFGNSLHPLMAPNSGSFSSFPGPLFSPVLRYEYPLCGIPVGIIPAAEPQPAQAVSCGRNRSQNDGIGIIIHYGVHCAGCGRSPIIGPRFKSKSKMNYNLCNACFATMGKDSDYNRIDIPAIHPDQWPSKELHDFQAKEKCPLVSQVHRAMGVNPGASKLDSCFILDVTMIDGTIVMPLTSFTKIWRMRNNGTVVWPEKTQLVWIGGDKLSNAFSVAVQVPAAGLAVNQELDVAVDFISPEHPGCYISHWRMASPSGQKFGQPVWVLIQVDATITGAQHGVPGLNLNLPPVNSVLTGPELDNSYQSQTAEELDSSMVGSGATNLAPTATSSNLYPFIDQFDMASPAHYLPSPYKLYPTPIPPPPPVIFPPSSPLLCTPPASAVFYPFEPPTPSLLYPQPPRHVLHPTPPPPPPVILPPCLSSLYTSPSPPLFYPLPPPAGNTRENTEELEGNEEVEKKLLRELEEMGFKQVDLNKEILRLHEYDFQRTVDELREITGWNPILE